MSTVEQMTKTKSLGLKVFRISSSSLDSLELSDIQHKSSAAAP